MNTPAPTLADLTAQLENEFRNNPSYSHIPADKIKVMADGFATSAWNAMRHDPQLTFDAALPRAIREAAELGLGKDRVAEIEKRFADPGDQP